MVWLFASISSAAALVSTIGMASSFQREKIHPEKQMPSMTSGFSQRHLSLPTYSRVWFLFTAVIEMIDPSPKRVSNLYSTCIRILSAKLRIRNGSSYLPVHFDCPLTFFIVRTRAFHCASCVAHKAIIYSTKWDYIDVANFVPSTPLLATIIPYPRKQSEQPPWLTVIAPSQSEENKQDLIFPIKACLRYSVSSISNNLKRKKRRTMKSKR